MIIFNGFRTGTIFIVLFLIGIPGVFAQAAKSGYTPKSGQPGKDIVWVPNPDLMVEKMLDMARVTRDDYVFDLGSGDGKNVIAAAKRGARSHGIEYNPDLVKLSKQIAAEAGVSDRATFERNDVFLADFSKATVVILFLTPEMNIRLRPKLLQLRAGSRVVANTFAIGDWNPDEVATLEQCERFCTARLWIVPAKVNGKWRLNQDELTLRQTYQTFSGVLRSRGVDAAITGRIRGQEIFFGDKKTQFTGRVDGNVIEGIARSASVDRPFRAVRLSN